MSENGGASPMSRLGAEVPERWPLVSAATMSALDQYTIRELDVPGEVLMESAGRAVVEEILAQWPGGDAEVCVVCGSGNNGGDGLVIARQLHMLGIPVRAVMLRPGSELTGDAAANWRRAERIGVPFDGESWRAPTRGVIVDALFGTGLGRPVEGVARTSIERINAARGAGLLRVVAVDLPSGIHSDTGQALGVAVEADTTVTISLPKLGLTLEPGKRYAGAIRVARIGIADSAPSAQPDAELWSPAGLAAAWPARPADGHKGRFGHVLLVAGGEGKTGAAALAARGAGRSGAGLVTVACPAGLNDILEVKCTEAMTVPVADTPSRHLAHAAEDRLLALAAERDVVACGPGIGREDETVALMKGLAKRIEGPLVLDADGLFAFASEPEVLRGRSGDTVLTPHPGEAARLLGTEAASINADRIGSARRLAELTGSVVILKGAGTVIAAPGPEGRVLVNPTGGPALGTGGTGDVLTGMVAALLAQGAAPFEAAAAAAYVHGAAADRLARAGAESGWLAGDIADEIPRALEELLASAADADASGGRGGAGMVLPFPHA